MVTDRFTYSGPVVDIAALLRDAATANQILTNEASYLKLSTQYKTVLVVDCTVNEIGQYDLLMDGSSEQIVLQITNNINLSDGKNRPLLLLN